MSAIRGMAELGQSSNPDLPRYHPNGIPLVENFIELVDQNDELAKNKKYNIGKIKLYSWINNFNKLNDNISKNGWILAEKWAPYQRSTFVTPPFATVISAVAPDPDPRLFLSATLVYTPSLYPVPGVIAPKV